MPREQPPRVRPGEEGDELPADVSREIRQISRPGKAGLVRDLLLSASRAFSEEAYAQALSLATQAKQYAPRSATIREILGLAYYRLGRWREAARELAAYRRMSDRRDQDHVYADCERALGRPDRALEILEGLGPVEVGEEVWVEALVVGAGALLDMNRPEEAVEFLRTGPLQPSPVHEHHLRLWYVFADALERAGRRSEARGWWDVIHAEDPDFFDVADRRLGLGGR